MRQSVHYCFQSATLVKRRCRAAIICASVCFAVLSAAFAISRGHGYAQAQALSLPPAVRLPGSASHSLRTKKFLTGRASPLQLRPAAAMDRARQQHAAMLNQPRATALTGIWQELGPLQISSLAYANVTGRVTSIAIDPADQTGNTVYIGTTGGGVWKSTNAAASSVTFTPVTDTLPVFSPDLGTNTIPSLSIGALSIGNGVILAGTGDPNDALDSYYGSGILRSADGGATWTLIHQSQDGVYGTHSFVGLGFAAFAWNTLSPNVAVAAVSDAAEGELVNAPSATQSVPGLYYSNDAGVTWQMATIKDGNQIVQRPQSTGLNSGGNAATAVVWNAMRQRFYAAVRYHGYYESTDGAAWTRLAVQPGTGLTASACPVNPGQTGSTACPVFRGTLAVEPVSGDTFAFTVDAQLRDQGIWRDICAASGTACSRNSLTFTSKLNTTPLEQSDKTVLQGDYDLSLAAVASGSDTLVFAGTVDLYRCSLVSGCNFRNTTNTENGCSAPARVAPSQHALAVLAGTSPLLYIGNDGGLWRSTDGVNQQQSPCSSDDATHFQDLNGGIGSLTEVVSFSQHPTDANTLLVGAGANGTAATSSAGSNAPWPQLAAGEGGATAIDPLTPTNWYISTGPGVSIAYCSKGPECTSSDFVGLPTVGPAQTGEDDSLIDAPWILDPALTSDVVIGTCRLWRGAATSGSSWSATNVLSKEFGASQNSSCGIDNAYVRALSAGGPTATGLPAPNSGSEALYAGLAGTYDGGGDFGGHIFSTSAANMATALTAWSDLALSPVANDAADDGVFNPAGFDISSVVVDAHDPTGRTVYATVMGFAGNGVNAPHLYRSIDAGAHWTNVTSNLPNAPANSVATDPNDSNSVYIAMDTGVYVTSQVTTCSTQNCWDILGVGLPNAPVVQLSVAAALPAGGSSTGLLRAATYGRGIWQIPLLTAAPPTSAQIALMPGSLSFAAQMVGSDSAPQSITVTNIGTAPLILSALATTGSFAEFDDCAGASLVPGDSCSVQVVFHAIATGSNTGVLTFFANIAGGQATASLTGVGVSAPTVVLNPLNLDFGLAMVGQTTAAQNITLSNTGGAAATLQPPAIAGDFQIVASTCAASLPSGVGCSLSMVFSPTGAGTRNGSLIVIDSAGTQAVSLTGRGASAATDSLSPLSFSFATQLVGTASASKTLTLVNSGDSVLTLIAAQIGTGDFTVINGCGNSLSGHATCVMQIAFAPKSAGQLTGALVVSDQERSQTVALSGTGTAPPGVRLSPATLSFPPTATGRSSPTQTIAVSNSGSGQVTISTVATTGPFTETDNCSTAVLTGDSGCTLQITFSPISAGAVTGSINLLGSVAGQQATASLAGVGLAPPAIVFTPSMASFGTVILGASSPVQNLTVANTGGVTTTLSPPTISGDFRVSANTCTNTLAAFTACTLAVVFTPAASGTRTGTLSITDSLGVHTAGLTGIGASSATDGLGPTALSFTSQQVGSSSVSQAVTLTNTGDTTLTLIAAQVTGGNFTAVDACGPMLAGHSSCTISVASTPTINGATSGLLIVSDQFRSQTVSLSGFGVAPPTLGLAPSVLSFTGTALGQSSSAQAVQISNLGIGQVTVTSVAITGDFTESNSCAGKSLTGSATCSIQVRFLPIASGARSGTLTVIGSTSGGNTALQATVAITGMGEALASIVLDPVSASFGTVTLGASSSPPLNVTISNTGGVAAMLQQPTISGDFTIQADTCGISLPGSTGCTVAIVFSPTTSGVRSGVLSITDSAGTQTATLTGIGAGTATDVLTPQSLTFAPQQVSTTSATQAVTLTNAGDNALTLIAVQVSAGSFTANNHCGPSLAGHASCAIAVAFNPATIGASTGLLTVSDQFRSQTVALTGSGLPAPGVSLTPAAGLTFAATGVAQLSAAQTVTLSNSGGSPLVIGGITVTGDFMLPGTLNSCQQSVPSGSSCTIQAVFAPTVAGTRTGTLAVMDDATGSPQTVNLTGVGIDFTLMANGASSVTVASGASAVYPLLLSSVAGTPGTAALTCIGAPANATCTVVPSSVPLGGTATIAATVETGVSTNASLPVPSHSHREWWATLLPLGFLVSRMSLLRSRPTALRALLSLILTASLFSSIGCGSGRIIPGGGGGSGTGPPSPLTPNGSYIITVSATSAGLTRSVAVTLVVK